MQITLNSKLNNQDTGGKFIYLGYLSWVPATQTTHPNHPSQRNISSNGANDTCFGIPVYDINNADSTPTILEYIATHTNNPYDVDTNSVPVAAQGAVLSYNTIVDFTNKAAGYYGFMYMVGDINNDGTLGNECGDVECFEIEVLDGFQSYDSLTLNYCSEAIPSTINLYNLLNTENSGNLLNGGTWQAVTSIPTSTLNPNTGTISNITAPITAGTYTYTYTLGLNLLNAYHTILPGSCSTSTITVTIIVSPNFSAGTANSAAVCN